MITLTKGNLLEAPTEALVNTVNTVGVMGKGIALMFKTQFPDNFKAYTAACKKSSIKVGTMFVTPTGELGGPKWIINFPTKKHWRNPTKIEWIIDGLQDLQRVIQEKDIRSIAIPPLGCGNGGLKWAEVRPHIETAMRGLAGGIDVCIYEPTARDQNVDKRTGVETLTPARALIAEIVRRYCVLATACTTLEVQKLAWFLQRTLECRGVQNPLRLAFEANKYGPYADGLRHLLDTLDGSYLHCDKRLADATPWDTIWFNPAFKERVDHFLSTHKMKPYREVVDQTEDLIDGFQGLLEIETLATIDWLLFHENCAPTLEGIKQGLKRWPGDKEATERKNRILGKNDHLLTVSLEQLRPLNTNRY